MGNIMAPNLSLKLTPERRLVMTMALRQALDILQMPQLELAEWLYGVIEKNPLLELDRPAFRKNLSEDYPAPVSLHEHLMQQIREHFSSTQDRRIAIDLLHRLDDKGFLPEETATGKVLSILQTLDPPGIFARSLRESLLLQLKAKGLHHTAAYALIDTYYEDLLHKRFALIQKKLQIGSLKEILQELAHLSLRPAHLFQQEICCPISPDLIIERIEGGWTVSLKEDDLPRFHLEEAYLDITTANEEEQKALRLFQVEAKWVMRALERRRTLLHTLGKLLLCKQASFLDQKGPLVPLSTKELAHALQIHESTLSRALCGKYVSTPRGIIPLKSLLLSDPKPSSAKQRLLQLVSAEDKQHPLTDEKLADTLQKEGFQIKRRTIAKYRDLLKIQPASQRKFNG